VIFIYALRDPISNAVRYIGKAIDPTRRLKTHISESRREIYKHHTSQWFRKLLNAGLLPQVEILCVVKEGENWQDVERDWIKNGLSLGWPLTNTSAGGDGVEFVSEEARQQWLVRLSERLRRSWKDPEYRAKIHNESTRAKMSLSRAAWLADPDRHAQFIRAMNRPDRTAAISSAISKRNAGDTKLHAKVKANWANPEHRAARLARMAETKSDPAWRERFAKSVTASWSDPVIREKRGALQRNPEVNAKRSASLRATWARRKAEKLEVSHA
jgi:hypothetical protein